MPNLYNYKVVKCGDLMQIYTYEDAMDRQRGRILDDLALWGLLRLFFFLQNL